MDPRIESLTQLAVELQQRMPLDRLLKRIVECAASVCETPRASLRLLDPAGKRLMAVCRAGEAVHEDPNERFRVGEGLLGWIAAHRAPIRTGDAEIDPRFVARPGMRARIGSFLGVPLVSGNACLGVLSVVAEHEDAFNETHEALLLLLAGFSAPHLEIARLSRLATVDPITGVLNRRGFDRMFPEVGAEKEGLVAPLSVCMVDVDHFKVINDELGHAVGDEVLRGIARRLAYVVRRGDAVVRYGGDEFLLVLPEVDLFGAMRIADRALEDIRSAPIHVGEHEVRATVSIGVAERLEAETREELVRRADAAMYVAKQAGRNRVRVSIP